MGTKSVDTIARVRRAFHVQGWSLKRICRELPVSRNTVPKILRSDETSFSYERERQPKSKMGPWQEQLVVKQRERAKSMWWLAALGENLPRAGARRNRAGERTVREAASMRPAIFATRDQRVHQRIFCVPSSPPGETV